MATLIELAAADDMPAVTAGPLATPLSKAELRSHQPNRHLMLVNDHSVVEARASCWWSDAPAIAGQRVGVIGHYAANDEQSGTAILHEAAARLAQARCTLAVGPMDGNTWRRYRFVVERGSEPAFFLEPDHPGEWPMHFSRAGFTVLATYTSALTTALDRESPRLADVERRLGDLGVTVRPIVPGEAEAGLRALFQLSLASFRDNFLYTPITEEEFLEQNRQVLPFVVPDLVLLAERQGALVGFVFALPDVLRQQRIGESDTMIVKTLAVSPAIANAGLGSLLVGLVQRRARALGYTRAIHALMHERNVSQKISGHYARTIRRYALFARGLATDAPVEP